MTEKPVSIRKEAKKQFGPHCRQLRFDDDCDHEIQNISYNGQASAKIIVKNAASPNKFEDNIRKLKIINAQKRNIISVSENRIAPEKMLKDIEL